jgi:hypothetical protein
MKSHESKNWDKTRAKRRGVKTKEYKKPNQKNKKRQ